MRHCTCRHTHSQITKAYQVAYSHEAVQQTTLTLLMSLNRFIYIGVALHSACSWARELNHRPKLKLLARFKLKQSCLKVGECGRVVVRHIQQFAQGQAHALQVHVHVAEALHRGAGSELSETNALGNRCDDGIMVAANVVGGTKVAERFNRMRHCTCRHTHSQITKAYQVAYSHEAVQQTTLTLLMSLNRFIYIGVALHSACSWARELNHRPKLKLLARFKLKQGCLKVGECGRVVVRHIQQFAQGQAHAL